MARPIAVLALAFAVVVGVVSATSALSEHPGAGELSPEDIQKILRSDQASRLDLYKALQKSLAPSKSESIYQNKKSKSESPLSSQSMKEEVEQGLVDYQDDLVGIELEPTYTLDGDVGSPITEPNLHHDDAKVAPPPKNGATALEFSAIAGVVAALISFLF